MEYSAKRLDYLDLTKAVAIICMVWLHIGTKFVITDHIVHVFHMPVFFVISGYLFKTGRSFPFFLKRKVKSLILPYFFWGILLCVFWTVIYISNNSQDSIYPLKSILYSLLYNNAELSPYGCIQWFFTTLFFANVFFYLIVFLTKENKRLIVLLSLILGLIGALVAFLPFRLPLGMDISFMAVFFMGIGYLVKDIDLNRFHILLLFLFAVICFVLNQNCIWNMRKMDYGIAVLYMMGSSSSSLVLIGICEIVCAKVRSSVLKPFLFIGKNSIWILIFNNLYINLLNMFLKSLSLKIPVICFLLLVITFLIPTIILGNKFMGWSVGKKVK